MWRQTALTLARCTRATLHHARLIHGRRQAIWTPNALHLNETPSRLSPKTSVVQFRLFHDDDSEAASGARFASQGEGFSRNRERRWEEERTAASYGGMLNTFYATKPNLERSFKDLLAQGQSAPESFVRKVLRSCSEELHTETPEARVALAKDMWLQMKQAGVPLGVLSYNAMLSVHLYNRQPFSPTKFLEEMKEADVMPNQDTLLRLLLGYCHQGDVGGAKQILQHAQTLGMSLTEQVYSALIMGKGRAGDLDGARSVLDMMKDNDITPGTESYGALAATYAEKGDMEGVERILQEMQDMRIFPNHTVYLGLLEALGMYDHHQHIPAVLTRIRNKKWLLTDLRKLMLFFAAAHKFEACVHLMSTLLQYDPFIELMSFNYCLRAVVGHMISSGTSLDVVVQLSKRLASISGQASINSQQDLMLVFYKMGDPDAVLSYARALVGQGAPVKAQHLYPVLATCSREGQRERLVSALRTIHDLKLPVERVMFELIAGNGKLGTSEVTELLKEAEVLDDVQFFTAFIRYMAFKEEKNIPVAVDSLLKNTSLTAEEVLQTLIDRVTDGSDLHKGYGAPNLLRPVFKMFGRMKLDRDPAQDVLKRVTAALTEHGVHDAIRLTETLLQMGAMPVNAEESITAILENLAEGEEAMQLLKFLQVLRRTKVALSDHHLNLVAKVTQKPVASVEEALTMVKAGLGNEVFSGVSELDRLIRSRRLTDALMRYAQMFLAEEPISKRSYISLLELVLSMGGVEMAEQIRSDMVQSGHPEYVKVRNCFVKAYARKGDFEKAKHELKEADLMLQSRTGPANYSKEGYFLLLRAYESHNNPQGMLSILEEMVTDGKPVPAMFLNLTIKALLKKNSVNEAFSLAMSASDRFGLNAVLAGHIALVNKLVEIEDYTRVAEVATVIEQLQSKSALDHILLFAELNAEHGDAARKIGKAEGFTPKPARLRQFRSVLKKMKKNEAVPVIEELMSMHGVRVVAEDPDASLKEKELLDMGLMGEEENPAIEAADLEGGTTLDDEDKRVGHYSEQGVSKGEADPDTVKS